VVAAAVDLERHEIVLRMLTDLLELDGWSVEYLGANVAPPEIVGAVAEHAPSVLALSVSLPQHLARLQRAIDAVRTGVPSPPLVLAGGRALLDRPALALELGADLTAADAREAVAVLGARFAEGRGPH
jgi:MerR family transcriptional regulator, light-induced transcriptional regulator